MKRAVRIVAVCLLATVAAYSQTITQAERDRALAYLESTQKGVVDATKGLSVAQWNFKSAPDRWSVAEVTEHIASAEDFLRSMVTDKVMNAPSRSEPEDVKALDEMVLKGVVDRSQKRQAPEPIKPSNRYGSPEGSLKHFAESRPITEEFLRTHDDLRAHATDSPFGKKLDAYEWVLFIAAHSERHTKQIAEVKADPNFPK
jgi:hypothetical protein